MSGKKEECILAKGVARYVPQNYFWGGKSWGGGKRGRWVGKERKNNPDFLEVSKKGDVKCL